MDRRKSNLAQLQLLLLEMERQLLIISAMIDRLRSRWRLPGGLPVIRQRRHRRYRFRRLPIWVVLQEEGQFSRPMPIHHLADPMAYRNLIQMPPELHQELEQRITAEFQRDRTLMSDPVSPGVKLAVTIETFVSEVCDAITRAYRDQVMRCPTLPEDWLLVESIFCRRWNFPHALGALDGRHVPIRCPKGGGSLSHNSKGFHSIILLALVDMGAAGSTSDAQIFKHTDLKHKIEDGSISFPDSESLGIGGPKVNFFLFGDDAFPPHALANEALLQPHYGVEGDGLQL